MQRNARGSQTGGGSAFVSVLLSLLRAGCPACDCLWLAKRQRYGPNGFGSGKHWEMRMHKG